MTPPALGERQAGRKNNHNVLMIAVRAATMNVVETITGTAAEMPTVIVMPAMIAALIPKRAVVAPIAVDEGAVISIIIPIIVVRRGPGNTDTYAHRSDLNANADLCGCAA
jgi:hypothetical protein